MKSFSSSPTSPTAISILFISLLLPAKAAISQTAQHDRKDAFQPSIDLSLGISGQLTMARTPMTTDVELGGDFVTQKTQSSSPSAGVLGTFHQSIRPWLGYNVNLGYTRFTQNYSYTAGFTSKAPVSGLGNANYSRASLGTNMYELTLAYVAEGPRHKRLRTFAQFGGGGLFFLPTDASYANQQTRPTMVFGTGLEYKFGNRLGIRAEYRGLFYKGPDFAAGVSTIQRLFTVTNAPSISLVYRFK